MPLSPLFLSSSTSVRKCSTRLRFHEVSFSPGQRLFTSRPTLNQRSSGQSERACEVMGFEGMLKWCQRNNEEEAVDPEAQSFSWTHVRLSHPDNNDPRNVLTSPVSIPWVNPGFLAGLNTLQPISKSPKAAGINHNLLTNMT